MFERVIQGAIITVFLVMTLLFIIGPNKAKALQISRISRYGKALSFIRAFQNLTGPVNPAYPHLFLAHFV